MNDAYFTQTAERPDLALLDVGVMNVVGDKLYPTVPVVDKSGTVYYLAASSIADAAAQTGRSAGVAPTATQIATSSTTFTAAEAVKRGSITPDEIKSMGGVERADQVGAKYAKRSVIRYREKAIATQVLTGTPGATFDPAKFNTQVQGILDGMQLYSGKKALCASQIILKRIVNAMLGDSKIGPMISRLASGSSAVEAARGFNLEVWRGALALYLGIDDVIVGDSNLWNGDLSAGIQNRAAIVTLDDSGDELSHKYTPVLGKVFQFLPDGKQPFMVKSIRDDLNVNNHYDAYSWYNIVEFNSGARSIIDGIVA